MAHGRIAGMGIGMLVVTLGAASSASAQPGQRVPAPGDGVAPQRAVDGPREGLTFGAAIGRGDIQIDCPSCDGLKPITEGLSLSLYGGLMLTPRLSVVGEYWSVSYNGRGSDWFPDAQDHYVAQHMVLAGAQLWVLSSLYVRAGIGTGWHHSDGFYARNDRVQPGQPVPASTDAGQMSRSSPSRFAPAASVGIGFEFAHTRTFACDVMLRAGSTRRPADSYQVHNVALTFGAAWF